MCMNCNKDDIISVRRPVLCHCSLTDLIGDVSDLLQLLSAINLRSVDSIRQSRVNSRCSRYWTHKSYFLKMGIKMHRGVVFWATSTMNDEKSAAMFHYIKTVGAKL